MESTLMAINLPSRAAEKTTALDYQLSLRVSSTHGSVPLGVRRTRADARTRALRLIVWEILDHGQLTVGHVEAEALAVALRYRSATGDHDCVLASHRCRSGHSGTQKSGLQAATAKAFQRSRAA